jgi:hypothetical protein
MVEGKLLGHIVVEKGVKIDLEGGSNKYHLPI